MHRALAAATALLLLLASGCGSTKTVTRTVTVSTTSAQNQLAPPNEQTQFGYIRKLMKNGDGYTMRFDPALLLTGVTANTAAAEDGAVPPGEPVPNDNYRLNETHRLLTYLVPPTARVKVLTKNGGSLRETTIDVAELYKIVNGRSSVKLFEPLATGVWLRIHIDTVRSIAQQYQP
jgi:hypothetical protein